jgi:hypothetical protein
LGFCGIAVNGIDGVDRFQPLLWLLVRHTKRSDLVEILLKRGGEGPG